MLMFIVILTSIVTETLKSAGFKCKYNYGLLDIVNTIE